MSYDLIILGGGPAGYLACERAASAGFKTLLIEKRNIGGVCLNDGCIPTKTLLYSAKIYDYAKHSDVYGIHVEGASFDHAKVIARKNKVVRTLVAGIKSALKAENIEIISGEGKIAGKSGTEYQVETGNVTYSAPRLLIATGSVAAVPPIPGLQEGLASGFVMTNREILDLGQLPKKLAIVGGGVIGLEMASYFCSAGSQVTILEIEDHIAGENDREICALLQKKYESKGVVFKLGVQVVEIKPGEVCYKSQGQIQTHSADKVLLSIGRKASSAGIGLESIGVMLERGYIVTNDKMQTNIPNVYAAGDINGKYMLAHTAYREAEVAVNNMLGKKDFMCYCAIPSVIYTNPEMGAVGETEESAVKKGLDVDTVKISMRFSGRYVAENEGGDGIAKLIIDKKRRTLVGAQVLANSASEFIVTAGIFIETEMTIDDIKKVVWPHPTVCEIIREAVFKY